VRKRVLNCEGEQSGLLTRIATESICVVRADEKLTAFTELERQVLTVTFYLESIHAGELQRR
jgi:hypothetical protein